MPHSGHTPLKPVWPCGRKCSRSDRCLTLATYVGRDKSLHRPMCLFLRLRDEQKRFLPPPAPRFGHGSILYGGRVYMLGGWGQESTLDDFIALDFEQPDERERRSVVGYLGYRLSVIVVAYFLVAF
jgi:hypothetical protein